MGWVRVGSVLSVIAATLALAGTASGVNGAWLTPLPPSQLLGSVVSDPLTIATAPTGDTVIAWQDGYGTLWVADRPPGASNFGAPVQLGRYQEGGPPVVAVDDRGDALVAWGPEASTGSSELAYELETAYRPAGGQFSASSVTAIPGSVGWIESIGVSFFADGAALVAWNNGRGISYSQRSPGAAGSFTPVRSYAAPPSTEVIAFPGGLPIVADTGGGKRLAWEEETTTYPSDNTTEEADRLMIGRIAEGGSLESAPVPGTSTVYTQSQEAATGSVLNDFAFAGNRSGAATLVWTESSMVGSEILPTAVEASYQPPGSEFQSQPQEISSDPAESSVVSAAVLPSGTAVIAGSWNTGGSQVIQRPEPASAFPTTAQELPGASDPNLLAGADQTFIAYQMGNGYQVPLEVYGAVAGDDQPFGAGTDLSVTNDHASPVIAGDGLDDAVVGWTTIADHEQAQVASYDGGPRALVVTAPANATAGKALHLSSTAVDPFDAVSYRWTFSDGGTATGSTVTHTWARAGHANATVVAIDAGGLATAPETISFTVQNALASPGLRLGSEFVKIDRGSRRVDLVAFCNGQCRFEGDIFATRWQGRGHNRRRVAISKRLGSVTGAFASAGKLSLHLDDAGVRATRAGHSIYVLLEGYLSAGGKREHVQKLLAIRG